VAGADAVGVGITGAGITGVDPSVAGTTWVGIPGIVVTATDGLGTEVSGVAVGRVTCVGVTGVDAVAGRVTRVDIAAAGVAAAGTSGSFAAGLEVVSSPISEVRGLLSFIRSTPLALTVPFTVPKSVMLIDGCDVLVRDIGRFGAKLPRKLSAALVARGSQSRPTTSNLVAAAESVLAALVI
jgi:hypothetical protein